MIRLETRKASAAAARESRDVRSLRGVSTRKGVMLPVPGAVVPSYVAQTTTHTMRSPHFIIIDPRNETVLDERPNCPCSSWQHASCPT